MKTNAFEVAYRYVYPSVRKRLVEKLSEKGLTQTEIAKLLHITQSAVSRYLSAERGAPLDLKPYPDIDAELEQLAQEILSSHPDEYQIHYHLVRISLEVLRRGYACQLHATIDPGLDPKKCKTCIILFNSPTAKQALEAN
ncbi:transcriptional regulator, XRE family [Pyrolobus fumarii 1A]|uniref:Transcriptional regulator, XRE family n=1 Tax=Pyrolobus fumarii (strain DSM 11204 / 1A) TaxID=694429 RepID=G0EHG7_PYRF1|nr:helix-turn-helix domain-containing protein [Pyrolobus fumarii]AEM38542.1 transcriptional regulator, XRE family [Pyrolobus fumarii 1A]